MSHNLLRHHKTLTPTESAPREVSDHSNFRFLPLPDAAGMRHMHIEDDTHAWRTFNKKSAAGNGLPAGAARALMLYRLF